MKSAEELDILLKDKPDEMRVIMHYFWGSSAIYETDARIIWEMQILHGQTDAKQAQFNAEKFFDNMLKEYKQYGTTAKIPCLKYIYERKLI